MGLLDSVTEMLGGNNGESLTDKLKGMAMNAGLESLTSKNPQLAEKLKGLDPSILSHVTDYIKEHGIPKSTEDIEKIIGNFMNKK